MLVLNQVHQVHLVHQVQQVQAVIMDNQVLVQLQVQQVLLVL